MMFFGLLVVSAALQRPRRGDAPEEALNGSRAAAGLRGNHSAPRAAEEAGINASSVSGVVPRPSVSLVAEHYHHRDVDGQSSMQPPWVLRKRDLITSTIGTGGRKQLRPLAALELSIHTLRMKMDKITYYFGDGGDDCDGDTMCYLFHIGGFIVLAGCCFGCAKFNGVKSESDVEDPKDKE